jgi:hypothetical protein
VSDFNNIEKIFQEKLENFEMPVRAELWNKVAAGAGIGKAVFDVFTENSCECVGYDILNGKDITNPLIKQQLVSECIDADVFINNALPNQSGILADVYKLWRGEDKTIVNLSSAVTYFYERTNVPAEFQGYYQHKNQLNNQAKTLQKEGLPHIINLRPFWVDTKLAAGVQEHKMRPRDLATLIYTLVINKNSIQILDMVVR